MDLNILIEVRPFVQACCVYIASPSSQASAQLVLQSENLTITWSADSQILISQAVSLPTDLPVKLQPSKVSSLLQEEKHLSFRIQTVPRNMTGSFSMQLLEMCDKASPGCHDEKGPSILPNVPCSIECACCGRNILSRESVTFNRILPLPSLPCDTSDFFCHNHGESLVNFNPNKLDFLYSLIGFQIHPSHLAHKENIIHCKGCFSWIGTMNSGKACLWNSTVNARLLSTVATHTEKLHPAHDFILLVKNAVIQSSSLVCRLVLDVRLKSDTSNYILLNVIDRKLTLLSAKSNISSELNRHEAIKVSYYFERHRTSMVSEWLNDPHVHSIELPLPVFVQGLKLLSCTSHLIPPTYRKVHQEFLLAYLCVDFIQQ